MVTCASICVLIAHHRWRTTKRDRWAIAAFAMYGIGLLCGEGAIAVCAYLFAYALILGSDTWRGRVMSLVPYAAVSGVYLVLYRVYGFGSAGSEWYADPGADFSGWLRMFATNGPILFFTETFVWPTPLFRAGWPWNAIYFGLMLAIILVALGVMRPMLRSSARARFWLLGAIIALVPVSSVVVQARVLTLSAIGVMGLLAEYLAGWFNGRQFAKLLAAIVGMTFVVRFLDSAHRLGYWMYAVVLALLAALLYGLLRYGEKSADWLPRSGPRRVAATVLACVLIVAHLIAGPNTLTVESMVHGSAGRKLDASYATLPFDASVVNRDLFVLQGANDFTCYYFMLSRSSNVQLMPGHMRMLAASFRPLTIERPDASTLVLRSDDGMVADRGTSIYRSRKYPMKPGETIKMTGVTATVLKTDAAGWPMDAAFSFEKPLDDDLYLWYTGAIVEERNPKTGRLSKVERYFPIDVPAVGEKLSAQELLERSPKYQAVLAAARGPLPAKS
jgi:hypothetical protein